MEWGIINRFQRPNGDINLQYDAAESLPVAFGPAIWEVYQLISNIKTEVKRYGNGNSFVCAVEFKSKSQITTCRKIVVIQSKHFYDQAEMYQKVNSKTFYFTKRTY
jgi:hypothetical protein